MIELVEKYKKLEDLGNKIPESLLLIDEYNSFLERNKLN